jgi:hypothetical protein
MKCHVPRCTAGDRGTCPKYAIKLGLLQAENEEDDPSTTNPILKQQMWVAYHSTNGEFTKGLRLVEDATQGWNEDNGTEWTAPAEPGPVRLWGVIRDNRGGTAWVEGKIIVD